MMSIRRGGTPSEAIRCELWIAELIESLRDTLGVFRTGLNENVDVLRRAGATVDGHCVCPDDDELSVVALE
jgi:hypothetical protein